MKFMSLLLVASLLLATTAPAMAHNNKRTYVRGNQFGRQFVGRQFNGRQFNQRQFGNRNFGNQALKQQRVNQYIQQQQMMANIEAQRQGLNGYGFNNSPFAQPYNVYGGYNPYTGSYGNGSYTNRILNSIFR